MSGADGLHFDDLRRWTFDDGADLGVYNRQQHWVTMKVSLKILVVVVSCKVTAAVDRQHQSHHHHDAADDADHAQQA